MPPEEKTHPLLLYLDAYHAGDPLFLEGTARRLAGRGTPPVAVLHDPTEALELAWERAGRHDGLPDVFDAGIERAARAANRAVVARLTEGGVAAFGVLGADRGIATPEGLQERGAVWLGAQPPGSVPVLTPVVADGDGRFRRLSPARVAADWLRYAPDRRFILLNRKRRGPMLNHGGQPIVRTSWGDFESSEAAIDGLDARVLQTEGVTAFVGSVDTAVLGKFERMTRVAG